VVVISLTQEILNDQWFFFETWHAENWIWMDLTLEISTAKQHLMGEQGTG